MSNLNHAHEYNRMMETAKKRAHLLREESQSAFWLEAGHAANRAVRSALRLATRIARHQRAPRSMEA